MKKDFRNPMKAFIIGVVTIGLTTNICTAGDLSVTAASGGSNVSIITVTNMPDTNSVSNYILLPSIAPISTSDLSVLITFTGSAYTTNGSVTNMQWSVITPPVDPDTNYSTNVTNIPTSLDSNTNDSDYSNTYISTFTNIFPPTTNEIVVTCGVDHTTTDSKGRNVYCSSASDSVWAVTLLPGEIKATSHGIPSTVMPPFGSPAKYSKTPTIGSIDNLISVWPAEELVLTVNLPEPFKSNPPPGLITWSAPGFTVPDQTSEYTFSWLDTGIKTITITVGSTQFKVVVDVPNVGNTSQTDAAMAINPIAAAVILADSQRAEVLANGYAGSKKDAMRHAYWNALSLSDSYVTFDELEFVTTAHEWNNKWGYDNWGNPAAPQPAFDSTMDLHNNQVGRISTHSISDGLGGQGPDVPNITSDLLSKFTNGLMYIWDGFGEEGASEGILQKSDRTKIYKNE